MAELETAETTDVVVRRVIAAPADRIFRAWTDAAQLKRWFTPSEEVQMLSAEVDAREGGTFRLTLIGPQRVPFSVTGTYRSVRPYELLKFTWIWEDPDMDVGETLVTIALTAQGSATELVLTHALLPNADQRAAHAKGWTALLEALAAYAPGAA